MSYYLEDDDELRALRERFMSSGPAPQYAGGGGAFGAPPDELNPSHVAAFLSQRPAEQQRAPYPIPVREDDDFLANNGFALLAAGLDTAFNKGRGLGQIAQGQLAGEAARKQRSDQQFEGDRRAYMGMQGMEDERRRADARNAYEARSQDLREQELGWQREKERSIQDRFIKGQEADVARSNWEMYEKPYIVTAADQAQIDARTAEREAERGFRAEQGDLDRAVRRDGIAATNAARGETAAFRAEAAEDRKTTAADKRSQDLIRQYNKDTEKYRPFASSARDIDATLGRLKQEGGDEYDIPGIGATGLVPFTLLSSEGQQIRNAKQNMADDLLRIKSGSAAPAPEVAKIERALSPGVSDRDFLVGYEAWRNVIRGQLRSFGAGREDQAREALRAAELEDWVYGAPQAEAAAATAPAAPPAPAINVGGNGRQQAARTPVGGTAAGGVVNGGARLRTVTGPDGSTEQLMLTDEDAAFLESQGGQVR